MFRILILLLCIILLRVVIDSERLIMDIGNEMNWMSFMGFCWEFIVYSWMMIWGVDLRRFLKSEFNLFWSRSVLVFLDV